MQSHHSISIVLPYNLLYTCIIFCYMYILIMPNLRVAIPLPKILSDKTSLSSAPFELEKHVTLYSVGGKGHQRLSAWHGTKKFSPREGRAGESGIVYTYAYRTCFSNTAINVTCCINDLGHVNSVMLYQKKKKQNKKCSNLSPSPLVIIIPLDFILPNIKNRYHSTQRGGNPLFV